MTDKIKTLHDILPTAKAAAAYCGIGERTLFDLKGKGQFPAGYALNGRDRGYDRADLDAWKEARKAGRDWQSVLDERAKRPMPDWAVGPKRTAVDSDIGLIARQLGVPPHDAVRIFALIAGKSPEVVNLLAAIGDYSVAELLTALPPGMNEAERAAAYLDLVEWLIEAGAGAESEDPRR